MNSGPTDDQLHAAWRVLARPDWGTFEQTKAAWIRFSLVYARARVTPTSKPPAAEPAPVHTSAPAPNHLGSLRVTHPEPIFDRKRAAAGEREDD